MVVKKTMKIDLSQLVEMRLVVIKLIAMRLIMKLKKIKKGFKSKKLFKYKRTIGSLDFFIFGTMLVFTKLK